MSQHETTRLAMPLLMAAQAQKHVTVNEALMRLDGMVNLTLQGISRQTPPDVVNDGECWAVPYGASAAWAGKEGHVAMGSNGGWIFAAPQRGMRAHVLDQGRDAIFDGGAWISGAVTLTFAGSAMIAGFAEKEVTLTSGGTFDTGLTIPDGVMVIGVVARVTQKLTGTLAAWQLGNAGATNRYGQGLGKALGSWSRGLLSSPMSYYSPANLIMTAEGGNFSGGKVRLSAHWLELRLPD